VTSNDGEKLGENGAQFEHDAARPLAPGVGFTSQRAGARDGLIVLGFLALVAAGLFASLRPLTGFLVNRIPVAVDASLGEKLGALQRASGHVIEDARTAHVRELVQRDVLPYLGAVSDSSDAPLGLPRITVLDDAAVNAFALPGGEIFVLRGLLDAPAMNDDALVGVLAHEVAHALRRHAMRGLVRQNLLQLAAATLVGGLDAGTVTLVGGGLTLGDLAYDRSMEAEADEVAGLVLLAGHRPTEPLAKFLEEIDTMAAVPALVLNHPPGHERAARLRAMSASH
jgi:predicted Zn-dependent protease